MESLVTPTKYDESLFQEKVPIAQALEKLRSRLLDLSLIERLLGFLNERRLFRAAKISTMENKLSTDEGLSSPTIANTAAVSVSSNSG